MPARFSHTSLTAEPVSNRASRWWLWLGLYFFYSLILPLHIGLGDSGSLALSAYALAGGHPPGYAGVLIFMRLFGFLPIANFAFRLHLASAFFYSLSFCFWMLLLRKLSRRRDFFFYFLALTPYLHPGLLGSVLQVEVYSFFALLMTFILFTLAGGDRRGFYAACFLFGFFYNPFFFLVVVLPFFPLWGRPREMAWGALFFGLGLLHLPFYLFRNGADPTHRFLLSTMYSLAQYVGAAGFQELSLPRLAEWRKVLPHLDSFAPFLWLLPVLFSKSRGRFGLGMAGAALFLSLPAFLSFDLVSYVQPAIFGIVLVVAAQETLRKVHKGLLFCFVLFFSFAFFHSAKRGFFPGNDFFAQYREKLYRELPSKSLLILSNRSTFYSFAFLYDHYILHKRRDLILFYPMYALNPAYLNSLAPQLFPARRRIWMQTIHRKLDGSVFPKDFFEFLFSKASFLKWLNWLTGGKIVWEMENHQRNLLLAEQLARAYPRTYFADREIVPYPLFFCRGLFTQARCESRSFVNLLLKAPHDPQARFFAAHLLGEVHGKLEAALPSWLKEHPEYQMSKKGSGYSITAFWLREYARSKAD